MATTQRLFVDLVQYGDGNVYAQVHVQVLGDQRSIVSTTPVDNPTVPNDLDTSIALSAAHGYVAGATVLIAGTGIAALDGQRHRVKDAGAAGATSFTVEMATTDPSASGTVTELVAEQSLVRIEWPESTVNAKAVANGRADGQWGNTEIEQLLLANQIPDGATVIIPGVPTQPAVVNPIDGSIIRPAIAAVPDTIRTSGPRFEGITAVAWPQVS